MIKISVAIATYNEERNLERCIKSVIDWIDEIVVVDGSSEDQTVKIARRFRAKVIITDNPLIFHINKQKAIDSCSGEWILQLDADEIVTDELRNEIIKINNQRLKTNDQRPINGYYLPRKNFLLGKWLKKGGAYPDYVIRLFKKGKGRFPCKSVHEQIVIEGNVGYLQNDLLHYPYPNFDEYLRKANIYTSLTASEFQDKKLEINLFSTILYSIVVPVRVFFSLYIRHLGILDGFPGFVWAYFSALHYPIAYIKYWEKSKMQQFNNEAM